MYNFEYFAELDQYEARAEYEDYDEQEEHYIMMMQQQEVIPEVIE